MIIKKPETVLWKGESGRTYRYEIYPIDTAWNQPFPFRVPGNYIFARDIGKGWQAIYIGKANVLAERLQHHERSEMIYGSATHVHIHLNDGGPQALKKEEADLIAKHVPLLNRQKGNKERRAHSTKKLIELKGSKIRVLRNHYRLTQREMADPLGISKIAFGFMDRGQQSFPFKRRQKLLKLFDLKHDLFDPELGVKEFKAQLPLPKSKHYQMVRDRFRKKTGFRREDPPQQPLPKITDHNLLSQHDGIPQKLELNFDVIAEKMVALIEQITEPEETISAEMAEQDESDSSLITIGIYGPWGAGKSTLIHALDQELDDEKYFKISLNPWKWDGKGTIHGYVLKAVLRTAGEILYKSKLKKWPMGAKWVNFYMLVGQYWSWIFFVLLLGFAAIYYFWPDIASLWSENNGTKAEDNRWVSVFSGALAGLLLLLNTLGKPLKDSIENALSEKFLLGKTSNIGAEALQNTYHALKQASKAAEKRFVFFIDDLDRCMPERVTEFIESIHSLTTAGCIVFVACDEEYLSAAINAKHEAIVRHHPDKEAFGRQFIEKIVQIPFRIPSVNEDDIYVLGLASKPGILEETPVGPQTDNPENDVEEEMQEASDNDGDINKDGGQKESQEIKVDKVLLSQIFGELLDGHVKLLRLNLRQVKSLSNTINLLLAIFESDFRNEEDAKRMAAFIIADQLDPLWLDGHYYGNPTTKGRIGMHESVSEKFATILGKETKVLDDFYWRIGRHPAQSAKNENGKPS